MEAWLSEIARLSVSTFFAAILVRSAVGKLMRPLWFRLVLKGYKLLPRSSWRPFSKIIPIVEVAVAVSLTIAVAWPYSLLIAAALIATFTSAVVINVLKGNRYIICGCFGPNSKRMLDWSLVRRNCVLIAVAIFSSLLHAQPPENLPYLFSLIANSIVMTTLIACAFIAAWRLRHNVLS